MPRKINKGVSHKKRAMFAPGPNTVHASPSIFCEPDNMERADRIPPTLAAYVKARGDGEEMSPGTDCTDLLTDLMHWAYRDGYDFDRMLTSATVNFNEEKGD